MNFNDFFSDEDSNDMFDRFDFENEKKKINLFSAKAIINYLTAKRIKDNPRIVLEHIKKGGKVSATNVVNNFAKNIADSLMETRTSFIVRQGSNRTSFIVRDVNKDALQRAINKTRYELRQNTRIYNFKEFEDAIRQSKNPNEQQMLTLTGLSRVEAELIRRELSAHSAGIKFAMSRMIDNTWTMAFKASDYLKANGIGKFKTSDILTAYTVAKMQTSGPNKTMVEQRINAELDIERKAVDKFSMAVNKNTPEIFVYDALNPKKYIKISKNNISFFKAKNDNGEVKQNLVGTYQKDDVFLDAAYIRELESYKMPAYAKSQMAMDAVILDNTSIPLKNRRSFFKEVEKREGATRTLAVKLTEKFTEKYRDYEFVKNPAKHDMLLESFTTAMASMISELSTGKTTGVLSPQEISSIQRFCYNNNIDIRGFQNIQESMKSARAIIETPKEVKMNVRERLEAIKKEMNYDSRLFEADFEASKQEQARIDAQQELMGDDYNYNAGEESKQNVELA